MVITLIIQTHALISPPCTITIIIMVQEQRDDADQHHYLLPPQKTPEELYQEVARVRLRMQLKTVECQVQEALNENAQFLSLLNRMVEQCQQSMESTAVMPSYFDEWLLPAAMESASGSGDGSEPSSSKKERDGSIISQESSLCVQFDNPSLVESTSSGDSGSSDSNRSTLEARQLFTAATTTRTFTSSDESEDVSQRADGSSGSAQHDSGEDRKGSSSSSGSSSRADQIRRRKQEQEDRVRDVLDSLSDQNERRASF